MRALAAFALLQAARAALQPRALHALPYSAVTPSGWLLDELRVQAAGLQGAFPDHFAPWNASQWLGGTDKTEDWMESFPYMFVGSVGQAFLLRDGDAIDRLFACYEHVLSVAASQGGWLGPPSAAGQEGGMVYWPRWPICMVFISIFEWNSDPRGVQACIQWTRLAAAKVAAADPPLGMDYAGVRTQDWLWAIQSLLDLPDGVVAPADAVWLEGFALELQARLKAIVDYEQSWYVDPAEGGRFVTGPATGAAMNLVSHGVNNGMALKSGAMRFRLEGGTLGRQSSFERLELMDRYHGLPSGIFSCDEHLAGTMPSHGTETCTVVEAMLSYNVIFETFGDAIFAERAERIAYNALPGAMTKDMWARVYLQQSNEPISVSQNPHVWLSDGPDAILYSLKDNYLCCTANFGQGWPRFIQRMVLTAPEDGAFVLAILGPVNVTVGNTSLAVVTDYPFSDVLTLFFSSPTPTPLRVRIPSWAASATMAVGGSAPFPVGAFAGQLYTVPISAAHRAAAAGAPVTVVFDTAPSIRIERFFADAASVHRGALAYALQLEENFTTTHDWGWGAKDFTVTQPQGTRIAWNSALVVDPADPARTLTHTRVGPVPPLPFSSTVHSSVITGTARALPGWGFASDGSAAPPPQSPVDCAAPGACSPATQVVLTPFGATHLRMTELPWTQPV